jgi:hypothetical protein
MYELGQLYLKSQLDSQPQPNLKTQLDSKDQVNSKPQPYLKTTCGAEPVSAFQWFTTAARFGSQESKAQAAKLAPTLSPAQRKAALLAVDAWIRQHPGSQKDEDQEDEGRK